MLLLLNHRLVIVILTALAAALRIWDPAPIVELRHYAFDTYQRIVPRSYDAALPVRIIDIDEASLEALGQWPWPRTRLAELVNELNRLGAAAIGFDFIFSDADRTSPEQIMAGLPLDVEAAALMRKYLGERSHDQQFAEAIGAANTVLGAALTTAADTGHPARASFAHSGDDPRLFVFDFPGITGNIDPLENNAAGLGVLNWIPDSDQIVRRIPVIARLGDRLYPALAAELLRVAQGASTYVIKSSGASGAESFGAQTGVVAVKIGNLEVPTTAAGEMWLHFAGTQPERFISARDVLDGAAPAGEIEGRIVLVGTSATGLFDIRATPLDVAVPGVEVHAEALEQMITGAFLIRPDFAPALEIAYVLVLGLIVAWLIGWIGPQWTGLAALAMIAAANTLSWFAFAERGWLVDPVYPTLMGAGVYVFGTLAGYLRTEVERDRVRNAFAHYLAPSLVEQLAANPSRLTLGGEMREVSILFTDIRGFTSISEHHSATELTRFLNRFLTPMTDVILAHGGTIDKYMGDAIMAFWNAPIDDPAHPANACRTALEMEKCLAALNRELIAEAADGQSAWLPVRIGIGINSGPCCVGNLGSEQRFAYSAIGDSVNVASRLEGQTKVYGTAIVVGETTAEQASDFALLEVDRIVVQGKAHPVRAYALLGDEGAAREPWFDDLSSTHAEMLTAFRARKWAESSRLLERCAALDDGRMKVIYQSYRERITAFRRHPPATDWDGVVIAETK